MTATCMPIREILGHVIMNQETRSRIKQPFLGPNFINSLIIQQPLHVKSVNFDKAWLQMETFFLPNFAAPGRNLTKFTHIYNPSFFCLHLDQFKYKTLT